MDAPARPRDALGRPLRNLRVSVTDRCNLRCSYCMPEENYVWLPRDDILRFEEISVLVDVFMALGVDKLRLTGGEPLLRHDLPALVHMLAPKAGLRDLALTTNALRLPAQAEALRAAGLHRLTVSLDTLDRARFHELTRRDDLPRVIEGIDAAYAAGFRGTKLNAVLIRGFNDDELVPLLEFGREHHVEVRFIEYMDVGGATRWTMQDVVSREEILATLAARLGEIHPIAPPPSAHADVLADERSAPANRYRLADGTVFGVIASTTDPFCGDCNRSRLTSDGMWFRCLYAIDGLDLRRPLREGASAEEIARLLRDGWGTRTDRAAEERHAGRQEGTRPPEVDLRRYPHLEMHKRGG